MDSPLFCIPLWFASLLPYCLRAVFPSMLLLLLQLPLHLSSSWSPRVHRSALRVALLPLLLLLLLLYAFQALIYAHSSYCWLAQYSWVGLSKRDRWENCGFGQFGHTIQKTLSLSLSLSRSVQHTFRCRQCTVMTWFLAPKCPKEPEENRRFIVIDLAC